MSRRMFSTDIVGSDVFLDMPSSTQALYFHLNLHCDDDGFVYPKKVMRMVGASGDDLKILLAKKFILSFETGVVVIKHWRVNNYIRPDRYHPTPHREQMALLSEDRGKVYHLDTSGIPLSSRSKKVGRKVEGDFSKEKRETELTPEQRNERMASIKESLTKRIKL